MSNLNECPNCGRKAQKAFSSNWFPVHKCGECGTKYCDKCGAGSGKKCPKCGSTNYSDYDKVYSM